jgi:Asp-tRNA(Asn)/Glu-tRNA(Gln) amidotransferase A subunit family amidase
LEDFDRVWEDVQVVLTPTTLTTAPLYKEFVQNTNRDQCALQDYCTQPANMAGNINKVLFEDKYINNFYRCASNNFAY